MKIEQEVELNRIIQEGRVRIDLADALRALIERVADEAWDSGKWAGESPYDGSWPSSSHSG